MRQLYVYCVHVNSCEIAPVLQAYTSLPVTGLDGIYEPVIRLRFVCGESIASDNFLFCFVASGHAGGFS